MDRTLLSIRGHQGWDPSPAGPGLFRAPSSAAACCGRTPRQGPPLAETCQTPHCVPSARGSYLRSDCSPTSPKSAELCRRVTSRSFGSGLSALPDEVARLPCSSTGFCSPASIRDTSVQLATGGEDQSHRSTRAGSEHPNYLVRSAKGLVELSSGTALWNRPTGNLTFARLCSAWRENSCKARALVPTAR